MEGLEIDIVFEENSGFLYKSSTTNFVLTNLKMLMTLLLIRSNHRSYVITLTGGTFTLIISCPYFLSYMQLPITFPNILKARFNASVAASFFAFRVNYFFLLTNIIIIKQ